MAKRRRRSAGGGLFSIPTISVYSNFKGNRWREEGEWDEGPEPVLSCYNEPVNSVSQKHQPSLNSRNLSSWKRMTNGVHGSMQ